MKAITDKKMDMNKGSVDSDGYFPEEAHHKKLSRVGEIKANRKYPDTEEEVYADSEQFVREANKNKPKPGFRH